MCIHVTRRKGLPQEGEGWKVFDRDSSGHLYSCEMGGRRPVGKWLKAKISTEDSKRAGYLLGWHVFLTKPLLTGWGQVSRKIKWRNPICRGKTLGSISPIIVTHDLYIYPLRGKDSKPKGG